MAQEWPGNVRELQHAADRFVLGVWRPGAEVAVEPGTGMAQRVALMYAGQIVEQGKVRRLFARPGHPYTRGLMASVPRLAKAGEGKGFLPTIAGTVPDLFALPPGCRFQDRCPGAEGRCLEEEPPLEEREEGHFVRCWREP